MESSIGRPTDAVLEANSNFVHSDFYQLFTSFVKGKVSHKILSNCQLLYKCTACENVEPTLQEYMEHFEQCQINRNDGTIININESSSSGQTSENYVLDWNECNETHMDYDKILCLKCNQKFATINILREHYAIAHLGYKRYKCKLCKLCPFTANSLNSCEAHGKKEHKIEISKSDILQNFWRIKFQITIGKKNQKRQTATGSNEAINKQSNTCQNDAKRPRITTENSSDEPPDDYENESNDEVPNRFKCNLCSRGFPSEFECRKHAYVTHRLYISSARHFFKVFAFINSNDTTSQVVPCIGIGKPQESSVLSVVKDKLQESRVSSIAKDKLEESSALSLWNCKSQEKCVSNLVKDKPQENSVSNLIKDQPQQNSVSYLVKDKPQESSFSILIKDKPQENSVSNLVKDQPQQNSVLNLIKDKPQKNGVSSIVKNEPQENSVKKPFDPLFCVTVGAGNESYSVVLGREHYEKAKYENKYKCRLCEFISSSLAECKIHLLSVHSVKCISPIYAKMLLQKCRTKKVS